MAECVMEQGRCLKGNQRVLHIDALLTALENELEQLLLDGIELPSCGGLSSAP